MRLTRHFLERIEAYDRRGPHLNAVLEVNPEALEIAEALDRERASTGSRGPLHGIPVLLKDNIATADRLHTSAGSLALGECVAPRDAFLVTRLREAGAVILGKTNMTEWANFMTTGMPAGYSSRGGQVVNPYEAALSPGGSSSGSAVAVTADLRSEEHTSELQSQSNLVCRLLLEKKKKKKRERVPRCNQQAPTIAQSELTN